MVAHMAAANVPKYRQRMADLEQAIRAGGNLIEFQVNHYFAHGTYVREMLIPKGAVVIGKIHRHSCINILLKGKLRVANGESWTDVEAPLTFTSEAGIQKAVVALEDTIIQNVHPWDGQSNLEEIEKQVIAPSYEALESQEILE